MKGGLLHCERPPFSVQYAAFYKPKDGILQLVEYQHINKAANNSRFVKRYIKLLKCKTTLKYFYYLCNVFMKDGSLSFRKLSTTSHGICQS